MAPSDDGSDFEFDANFFKGIRPLAKNSDDHDIRAQKASSRPPVPDEIWVKIWQLMVLDDKLAVARVCTEWRRLARAQRSLWKHLDFRTSRHQRNCRCDICDPRDDASFSSDLDADDWLWNVSNLHHAAGVLQLSGDLELHITLEVQTYYALSDELYALGSAMELHADRIATLIIRTADTAAYYTFLARFESLRALRSFSGVLMGTRGRQSYGASFVPAAFNVPELQTVRINRGFCFPTPQIGRTFSNVRDIAIAPVLSISGEVTQALAACRNLESFALDLHAFERPAPFGHTDAAIQQHASALQSVSVSGITLAFEHWVLGALAHPALQTLVLEYDSPHDISLGWSIFASLSGPLTLRVSMKNRWPEYEFTTSDSVFCMDVADVHGRTRRIVLHNCTWDDAHAALAHLAAMQLHKTLAPYALWPLVGDVLGPSALDTVELVISTYDVEDQAALGAEDQELALRGLTLVYDGPGTLSLPAARVEQLVRRMRLRLPLDLLTLDHRLAASVPDASLARSIAIISCSIPVFPLPTPLRDTTRYESDPASEDSDLDESDYVGAALSMYGIDQVGLYSRAGCNRAGCGELQDARETRSVP